MDDKDRQSSISERLILLINKVKIASVSNGVYRLVRIEFEAIRTAREALVPWRDIAETCGIPGREARLRDAFMRERRRRGKKGLNPETRKEGTTTIAPPAKKEQEVVPDAKAKIQKESVAFSSEDKAKGGKIGPPKPIGRGRLDLGENTPDDEL